MQRRFFFTAITTPWRLGAKKRNSFIFKLLSWYNSQLYGDLKFYGNYLQDIFFLTTLNLITVFADTLSRKEWLKRMEVHIIRELDKYRCGLCFKLFTRKDSLQSHFEHFHTSSRYPCEYCGQIFESRNNRRVHYHKQHYEEHKYRRQAEQQNEQQSSH